MTHTAEEDGAAPSRQVSRCPTDPTPRLHRTTRGNGTRVREDTGHVRSRDKVAIDAKTLRDSPNGLGVPPPLPGAVRLVMMGPPGSGKGTQSALLARTLRARHIAVGDVLRFEADSDSPLGRAVRPYLSAGMLLPDRVVSAVVASELDAAGSAGFVLDGFPRTLAQSEILTSLLEHTALDAVINLVVSRAVVLRRLRRRRVCAACSLVSAGSGVTRCAECGGMLARRSDDVIKTIERRLAVFDEEERSLRRRYSERGLVRAVDGHGSVDGVASRVLRAVSSASWPDPVREAASATNGSQRYLSA